MTRRSKRKESEPGADGGAAADAAVPAPKKAKEKEKAKLVNKDFDAPSLRRSKPLRVKEI